MKKLLVCLLALAMWFSTIGCTETGADVPATEKQDTTIAETQATIDTVATEATNGAEPTVTEVTTAVTEAVPVTEATEYISEQPTDVQTLMVWIPTKGGKKYHTKESCSGMIEPNYVAKSEAEQQGFTPCKNCYK